MSFPFNTWLRIVEYRDFFDLPRYMLVTENDSSYWILDCAFNEEIDEYPEDYLAFCAGNTREAAAELFARNAMNPIAEPVSKIIIPLTCVQFDETRRKSCFVREQP